MFTGLIEQQALVIDNLVGDVANRLSIRLSNAELDTNFATGESIAVNGVCLTLLPGSDHLLEFDVSPETLRLTTLGQLQSGDKVNLERTIQSDTSFW